MFSFAFAIIWYLISSRYARLNIRIGYVVYFTFLIAIAGLTIGILVGKFGAGWFLLYPLPFRSGTWLSWSTGVSIISLIILGIAWLIGIAIFKKKRSEERASNDGTGYHNKPCSGNTRVCHRRCDACHVSAAVYTTFLKI